MYDFIFIFSAKPGRFAAQVRILPVSPFFFFSYLLLTSALKQKNCTELGICISSCFTVLKSLDISNTQPPKKAMISLLETLTATPSLFATLENLSLSQIKLEEEGSRLLGVFLRRTKALTTLKMRSSAPVFLTIIAGMKDENDTVLPPSLLDANATTTTIPEEREQEAEPLQAQQLSAFANATLTELDISKNKVTKYSQGDVVSFINLLPNVTNLNLNGTDISASSLKGIVKENMKTLDISRNYLPDEHIISLMEHLLTLSRVVVSLLLLN